ncbi:MAG: SURF1 family protein [Actinomycetota bacterium]|nr:SURF1 family protein [Actinomycetota bacterium]
MFGFLLSRRWVLFALFVVFLGVVCWRLGVWQFDRLQERRADNAIIERNLDAPAAPAEQVMSAVHPLPEQQQWRKVTVTGTYDMRDETLVRYQTRDGRPGVSVLTPLRTVRNSTVLVDRGWMAVTNNPTAPVHPPPPVQGRVTVTGWAVPDQSGEVDDVTPLRGEVRLVSSRGFTQLTDRPLLQGYVLARSERPPPQRSLVRAEPPELNSGPHFFYGLQWWFFAALAVGGFVYFAYTESRERRRPR